MKIYIIKKIILNSVANHVDITQIFLKWFTEKDRFEGVLGVEKFPMLSLC